MELEEEKVKIRKYVITGIVILLVIIFLISILKTFKSSNKKVATVTKKGVITAKKKGTTKITVTTKAGAKATCKIKVK